MRALQALVVFLGLLIVAGVGLLVVLLVQGPHHSEVTRGGPSIPATSVSLPPGYRVVEMAGAADHIVLRLDASDGRQALAILDPATGLITHILEVPFQTPGIKP